MKNTVKGTGNVRRPDNVGNNILERMARVYQDIKDERSIINFRHQNETLEFATKNRKLEHEGEILNLKRQRENYIQDMKDV